VSGATGVTAAGVTDAGVGTSVRFVPDFLLEMATMRYALIMSVDPVNASRL
jgi:hypothetical protein